MTDEKNVHAAVGEVVDAVAEVCRDMARRREGTAPPSAKAEAASAEAAAELLARWRGRLPEPAPGAKPICSKC